VTIPESWFQGGICRRASPTLPVPVEPILVFRIMILAARWRTTMMDGLVNIASTGITGPANVVGDKFSVYDDRMHSLRTAVGWLPTVVILAAGVSLLPLLVEKQAATHTTAVASVEATAATTGLAKQFPSHSKAALFDPSVIEAIVPEQPAPVDGLKISSQSWRRGGLGSNAFVTMTLRNNNEYSVKNIDVSCAFMRPDGSHLTDRTRLISDAINMKSRKTFVRLHVGFVNVNATKAKCSLLAASHV
jgi:hypothetical protein